ncbi:TPA: hypothetical protein L4E51_006210 [Pseudomonas aeruginosa]|nr:hypothetical protein [Pseudomonas aeruginosa]
MLNRGPLNSAALNSAGHSSVPGPEPIIPGFAFTWRAIVRVGDVDVTPLLTGEIEVDREEGAAGVASFSIYLGDDPVVPADWIGRTVTIDYATETAGELSQGRRFTGRVTQPAWNPVRRVLGVSCTDQLQQRVEAMAIADVDALVGGKWSADVFESVEGRSRWDYAQERLTSVVGSLDCSAYGALRVTSWHSVAPTFEFGPGSTVYGSLAVELADLSSQTNRVEIECDYRFSRLWQWNINYGWKAPGTDGQDGEPGFCNWRPESHELPDTEMVESATSSSGQTLIQSSTEYYPLPPTGIYYTPPQSWANKYTGLLLGADWAAGRRWVQAVTESYRIAVEVQPSVLATGPIISRSRASFEIDSDLAESWESAAITGGSSGHIDQPSETRRIGALTCLLEQARATLVGAHRGTTVSWDCPTSMVMAVDLTHTLKFDDQRIKAVGKCRRVLDRFDLESGSAITTLSIAVMRGGGGDSDVLTPPSGSGAAPELPAFDGRLESQIAGHPDDPPFDESKDGFSGNYDNYNSPQPRYPRQLRITAPEIPASLRDEYSPEIGASFRVSVPDDLLEM